MRLSWRDGLATFFVAMGASLYGLWLAGVDVPGVSDSKVLGALILGLGLAASVTAVVYGVGAGLLQAPKAYLWIASIIGLIALVAGTAVLVNGNGAMLGILMAATIGLWLMATIRHVIEGKERSKDERHAQEETTHGSLGRAA